MSSLTIQKAIERGDSIVQIVFSKKRGVYVREAPPWVYDIRKGSASQLVHWYLVGKLVPEFMRRWDIHHVAEIWHQIYGYYPRVKIIVSDNYNRHYLEREFDDPYEAQVFYEELNERLPKGLRVYPLFQVILPSEKYPYPYLRWLLKQNLVMHLLFKGIKYSEVPRGVRIPKWLKKVREKYGEESYKNLLVFWLKRWRKPIYKANVPIFTLPVPEREKIEVKPIISQFATTIEHGVATNGGGVEMKDGKNISNNQGSKDNVIKLGEDIAEEEMKRRKKKIKKERRREIEETIKQIKEQVKLDNYSIIEKLNEIKTFLGKSREKDISQILNELKNVL